MYFIKNIKNNFTNFLFLEFNGNPEKFVGSVEQGENGIEKTEQEKEREFQKAKLDINKKSYYRLFKGLENEDPNNPEAEETFRLKGVYENRAKDAYNELTKKEVLDAGMYNQEVSEEINTKTKDFFDSNEKLKLNKDYKDVVEGSFQNGLSEDEVGIIVTGDFEKVVDLNKEAQEKIYETVKTLEFNGMIDGEKEPTLIEGLKEFLRVIGLAKFFGFDDNGEAYRQNYETYNDISIDGLELDENIKKVIEIGASQIGLHESNRESDKFFKETGHDLQTDKIPWCAAYVNWTLEKSGHKGTGSNASKSFIGMGGYGHVGFKVGDKILGGNQSNKVCLKNINESKIAGWVMPDKVGVEEETHRRGDEGFDVKNIPNGAILVYNRTSSDKNMA